MKLYHGTSEVVSDAIKVGGIHPRGLLDVQATNWKHTVESNPDCVYLTDAYAGYFAFNAAKDGEKLLLIEVDTDYLDESALMPDEDFIAQALQAQQGREVHPNLNALTLEIRGKLKDYQRCWSASLEHMGTCCYRDVVPVSAITRMVTFDSRQNPGMCFMLMDPSISIANYRFCADKYRALTAWLMGNTVDTKRVLMLNGLPEEAFTDANGFLAKSVQATEQLLDRNRGVTVIYDREEVCDDSKRGISQVGG